MSAEQSAKVYRIAVENDWDRLAEVAVASYQEPSTQIDHLSLLLESHGVVVHKVPASRPQTTQPAITALPPLADPYTTPVRSNTKDAASGNPRSISLFPQNTALVYGTRVIEVPSNAGTGDASKLFSALESANVEVIRWSAPSTGKATADLVDLEESAEAEEEGPRFSPSDVLVLSPTLLLTRLSSRTNNKGLEYLWSVLSKPQDKQAPTPYRATTTLLVRITEPGASNTISSPSLPPTTTYSPRMAAFPVVAQSPSSSSYTPLNRALVPIDGRIMLYDPALIAAGEARRLKSVLDRVQEGPGLIGEMSEIGFTAKSSKRDSTMSYGTFGSVTQGDSDGWQFISIEGLHYTSILLVSPNLALISSVSQDATSPISTNAPAPAQDFLSKISQVLESLDIRSVSLPFTDLNDQGGGVRDAVLILRRESEGDLSDDGSQGQQKPWDQGQLGEETPAEGCCEAITAALGAFLCGLLTENTSSEAG